MLITSTREHKQQQPPQPQPRESREHQKQQPHGRTFMFHFHLYMLLQASGSQGAFLQDTLKREFTLRGNTDVELLKAYKNDYTHFTFVGRLRGQFAVRDGGDGGGITRR